MLQEHSRRINYGKAILVVMLAGLHVLEWVSTGDVITSNGKIVFHNLQKFFLRFSQKAFYFKQIVIIKSRRHFPLTTLDDYLQRKSRECLISTAGIIEKCYKLEQTRLNKLGTNRAGRRTFKEVF